MGVKEYLQNLQSIQANILIYIDREDNIEENYKNIINIFDDLKISDNLHETKLILRLISYISRYHYRSRDFFLKIEKIILYFKISIKKYFNNTELFSIFEFNNRIILFLIREKLLSFDSSLTKNYYYLNYFFPEIKNCEIEQKKLQKDKEKDKDKEDMKEKSKREYYRNIILSDDSDIVLSDVECSDDFFISEESYEENEEVYSNNENEYNEKPKEEPKNVFNPYSYISRLKKDEDESPIKIPDDFEEKRSIGENANEICKLIRNDLIEEFITYVKKNDIQINSHIPESCFETHHAMKVVYIISLIDYAAFFGSAQVFKYLYKNGAKLDRSIWIYAINGDNPEIIHLLEENNILPDDEAFAIKCYEESIKCHNNEFANYIEHNYLSDKIKNRPDIMFLGLKYCNFGSLPCEFDVFSLYLLINLDYYTLFEYIIKENKMYINQKIKIPKDDLILVKINEIDNRNNIFGHSKVESELTILIISIELEKIDFFKLILSQSNIDVNINMVTYYYNYYCNSDKKKYDFIKIKSPLQVAYEKNNMEIIQMLLSFSNTDVNNQYIKKKIKGNVVDNKIDLDDKDCTVLIIKKKSLLSIAISDNKIEFIKLLLANPNIIVNIEEIKYIDSENCLIKYTPLIKALEQKNIEIVQLLLSNSKIDVNCRFIRLMQDELITEKTPLFISMILYKDNQIFNQLLSNPKTDVNVIITQKTKQNTISKRTVLYEAVEKNDIDKAKFLLSNPNIDVNIKTINTNDAQEFFSERTPLYLAVKKKYIEMIKLLLSHPKIDVNSESIKSINNDYLYTKKSILYLAVEKRNFDIVKLLLEKPNIDVNYKSSKVCLYCKYTFRKTNKTILYEAVANGCFDIVQLLLKNPNINVNETSLLSVSFDFENGDYIKCKTPLHEAILNGFTNIIEILLNNEKIDLNITDENKKKPIEITDDEKIISLFKKH